MNTRWAIGLADALAAEGLRYAVVCPGSRSTPMALALDHHPDITVQVHIDERGAGYFALGVGRTTRRPAAVLTTSGTAVANLLPAMAEAHQDNVPLVALTADRPPRLRHSGANQTMDQPGIFARFVRYEADLPVPAADDVERMRATAREAMRAATGWPPGPVHLNQPLEKPLEPDAAAQRALKDLEGRPGRGAVQPLVCAPAGPVQDDVVPSLGPRGLIVCGPGTGGHLAPAILRLADRLQAPVLADALSGLRHVEGVVGAYDLFLGAGSEALRPRFVIQFGRSPTSSALRRELAQQPCPRLRFDHSGRRWDDIGGDVRFVACDPLAWIGRLVAAASAGDAMWLQTWQTLDARARSVADEALRQAPDTEAAWVPAVTRHARRLFVGNSMPVRDLDRFGASGGVPAVVAANRGVSGIDGTIATAAGWATAAARPSPGAEGPVENVAVVGDVAFQHDVGSLALLPRDLRLVVVDNGGGRIFHHLPIHASDRFDRLFLSPPTVDIPAACAAFGIDAEVVAPSRLPAALDRDARVIVMRVDGEASARWRQEVERRVRQDAARLLAVQPPRLGAQDPLRDGMQPA